MEDKVIYDVASKDKGWLIAYDTKSLPDGMRIRECENVEKGEIYWDSNKGGHAPKIIHLGGDKFKERQNYKIVDLAKKPNE